MNFEELLWDKRSKLIKRWINVVFESYPADATQFLRRAKDAFSNPVGGAVTESLEKIVDLLIRDHEIETAGPYLDRIIRIRAVQKFTPSQGVYFVYQFKSIVDEVLTKGAQQHGLTDDLAKLQNKIDHLLFMAFDIHSACREKLYEIRVNDEHRRLHMLLKRANMTAASSGEPEPLPDFREED